MSKKKNKKLVPNLRFKGFTDDWIQDKLQNISLINPPSTLPTDIKYVDLESVKGTSLINYQKISSDSAPSRAQRLAEKGDIFYQTVRPYQKNNYYFNKEDGDFVFSTGYAQIRVDKTDKKFVFYKLQDDRFVNEVMKKSTGTSYPAINTTDLSRILLNIPKSKCEQEKIGNVLKKIDNIITLEQEKLAHYKQIKMMLLSKLFATKENSVPEMRFKEFSEKWAQHELSEISSITMGQSPSSNNYTNNPNDYILVQGNADLENGKVIPRIWTTEVTKSVNKGAIILTVRAPVGDVAISHYEVVLGRGVAALTGNYFIYYLLIRMNVTNYWRKYSTGSTFESINSSDIQRALIVVPSLDEQEKIGYTLNKIDKIITLEQTRIEHYQSIKNNLLHNLFI